MGPRNFFAWEVYRSIKKSFPDYTIASLRNLIPLTLVASLLEVFGLLVLLPVIRILVDEDIIFQNRILSELYEYSGVSSRLEFVLIILICVVTFFVLKSIALFYISKRQSEVAYMVATRLTVDQFERYLMKPYEFHSGFNTGDLLRSIIELPFNFVGGILLPFVVIINEFAIGLLVTTAIVYYDPNLFLSVLLVSVPGVAFYFSFQKRRLRLVSAQRDLNHKLMFGKGKQAVEGFREIILFDRIEYFSREFGSYVKNFSDAFAKLYLVNSFSPRVTELVAVVSVFGIFVGGLITSADISVLVGFLIAFALASYRLIPSINKILLSYNNIRSADFVFEHFEKNRNPQVEEQRMASETTAPLNFEHKISVNAISHRYDGSSKPVLEKVQLELKKGQTIGIMGESGSGKTTLLNIFLKLLVPTDGEIRVDDVPLTVDNIRRWHRTLSYVPQNIIVLEGSIRENITFGVPESEVDPKLLEDAVRRSHLVDFVDSLEHGLDTRIGDRGLNISSGQKQRLAIARALYHNGQVMIFDEPTSSLDESTEQQFVQSIKELSHKEYTVIIVSHRPETLKNCDKVYTIRNGKLTENLS